MKREIKRIQESRNGVQFIISPEVREELKPLVFFDGGKFTRNDNGFEIGFHPHSGIGIITYFHGTDLHHKDSANNSGVVLDGGLQWIQAGKGVWHQEGYHRKQSDKSNQEWTGSIHQLWLQLPPKIEEGVVEYNNLTKEELYVNGNVKVVVGSYQGIVSKMKVPVNMTYLDVCLKAGETWHFQTPKGQTTGFIFTRDGEVKVGDTLLENSKMAILEHNDGEITIKAISESSNFIVVVAKPTEHDVVVKGGQIHTNIFALERSYNVIQELGKTLH